MERLTIKELAPYLPYDLKGVDYFQGHRLIRDITLHNVMAIVDGDTKLKPLLIPLSSLTEEEHYTKIAELAGDICFNEEYSPSQFIYELVNGYIQLGIQRHNSITQYLYKYHFDVEALFNNGKGLIDRGLALPIDGKEVKP